MSYDVYLYCSCCGSAVLDRNHTSNTADMWRAAGCDIAAFHGRPASEFLPVLEAAIAEIDGDRAKYKPMEPSNGWGTVDSTVRFLRDLAEGCRRAPSGTVEVSR